MVEPDREIINGLLSTNTAANNESLFLSEHSICGIITFIAKYFPGAKIVPLIMKGNTPENYSTKLAETMRKSCNKCLVIISSDFSHEVNMNIAKEQDNRSIEILKNVDEENISKISSDSIPGIRTLFSFLQSSGLNHGTIFNNSNSYEISGNHPENVTSYVTAIYY